MYLSSHLLFRMLHKSLKFQETSNKMHFSVTYIPKFQKKIGVYHGATSRNH